jgi:hypothetical protein
MPAVENNTSFSAQVFPFLDARACEHLVLVVTASFVALPGAEPEPVDEKFAIEPMDRHRGDPATSSVEYPGQLAPAKASIDVLVNGHAYAPNGRAVETMSVGVRVGTIRKVVQVTGDRFWRGRGSGRVPSSPKPFERLPVVYERAFGGGAVVTADGTHGKPPYEARNPVGVGLDGAASSDPSVTTEVPNLEFPQDRMLTGQQRPSPAAFGAIGPGWQPRASFAGTYDEQWLKNQAPLLPHDLDSRFFQVAPPDQQIANIRAGDLVEVAGMTPDGQWKFRLPAFEVPVWLVHRDRVEQRHPVLDTIHLEPDRYRFHLTGRLTTVVTRTRAPLGQIVLGRIRPGWLRARYAGKVYMPRKDGEA